MRGIHKRLKFKIDEDVFVVDDPAWDHGILLETLV